MSLKNQNKKLEPCRGINKFKNGNKLITDLVTDENVDLHADFHTTYE